MYFPKFADDVVSISVDTDINVIRADLQKAADELYHWSCKECMELNIKKNKVMVFSDGQEHIEITVNLEKIENVKTFKYLGVVLDSELNFSSHVDYTVGKAKRASAKVSRLIDGRKGIDIRTGIHLYKTLVRPHLEYAVPIWASISDKLLNTLESVQTNCIRRILGSKAHSSSSAIEVVGGVIPFRFRRRDLCTREQLRIMTLDNCHPLAELCKTSVRKGIRFSPAEFLQVMSKQLQHAIYGYTVQNRQVCSLNSIIFPF